MTVVAMQIAATAPATRPKGAAGEAAKTAVREAVAKLNSEFDAYRRNPAAASLRTTSNYFKDNPSSDVTSEAIVTALTAPGGNGRQAAYVRWQLLSGLPDPIDETTARGLLKAYRASPAPAPRPGMSRNDQQQLERIIRGKKEEQGAEVVAMLEQAISRVQQENAPIIAYRDELYRRLPKDPATFTVAMEDLKQRLAMTAEATDLAKAFAADVRDWAVTSGVSPQQMAQVARAARTLADMKSPQYYTSVTWSANAASLSWNKSSRGLDSGSELKDLAVFLEEQAALPPLELEIKD